MAAAAFSTKARSLEALGDSLASARILPLVHFTYREWQEERGLCQLRTLQALGSHPLIVRSSCGREDGLHQSNAGAFLSLPNVLPAELAAAVDQVMASYGTPEPSDEVLIQPMLRDVIRAGVAFSHDPNTAAPYRVVNWTEGADTAAVTAGRGGRTYQCAAAAASRLVEVAPVLDMVEELVARFDAQPVDCEFAVTSMPDGSEQLWLLQVRPLVLDRPVQNEREQPSGSARSPKRSGAACCPTRS